MSTKGVRRFSHTLAVELTGGSNYFVQTFREVVEHVYKSFFSKDLRRRRAFEAALDILLNLAKKMASPFVDAAWIDDLLKRAAWKKMDDEAFTVLLRLSALRKIGDATTETVTVHYGDYVERKEADPGRIMTSENPTPEYVLLDQVLRNVDTCGAQVDGWEDDAVYGGLIAIKDLPGLRLCDPKAEFIQTLSKAMENSETRREIGGNKPFRVRKAAYDVMLAMRDRWLKSETLRPALEDVDFPRKLHSVVIEILPPDHSDHQHSFLEMIEILSEDRRWHPYLRKAMDIWLPLHHEGPYYVLRTLYSVGELHPGSDGYNADKPLERVVEEEWAAVPARHTTDLTADRLGPLAEVTEQIKGLSVFNESDRKGVLAAVEQVLPSLERRRDEGYDGPDDEVRRVIEHLLKVLRVPIQANNRRPTLW